MARSKEKSEEADPRVIALKVVDLFFPQDPDEQDDNDQKILELIGKLEPVTAAAVAVEVCYELNPEEIADFLALLGGDPDEDPDADEDEDDGGDAGDD